MKKKVNIFGTDYELIIHTVPDTLMYQNGYNGYINYEEQKIHIYKECNIKEVLIHELIHGHLYECGLAELANDEKLVEIMSEIFRRIRSEIKDDI